MLRCGRTASGVLFLLVIFAGASSAEAITRVNSFGSNPGQLVMFEYVPANLSANAPLVVAMHGCTQSAASYDRETGWVALADALGFALVFPEQSPGNNFAGCFNWFEPGDTERDQGEPASIRQMITSMFARYDLDSNRVYVTGFSAGGAMTSVMLATYPEVFAGGGVVAGVPYECGQGLAGSIGCLQNPGSLSDAQWAARVFGATNFAGPWPRVVVWQGDADFTVAPANADAVAAQWRGVFGVSTPAQSDVVDGALRDRWLDSNGDIVVELNIVPGMGHGVPVDPAAGCGSAGAFVLDVGICSAQRIYEFWTQDVTPPGNTPPTVVWEQPASGALVQDEVTVAVQVSDDGVVDRVEFSVDGQVRFVDTVAPYAWSWDTRSEADGAATLDARAFDDEGASAVAGARVVTVANTGAPPPPPAGVVETFSDADNHGDVFDLADWAVSGFVADDRDVTGGLSRSLLGEVESGAGCAVGEVTASVSRNIDAAAGDVLSYQRQLRLNAQVNISSVAAFEIWLDGELIDAETVSFSSLNETDWVEQAVSIDRTVSGELEFRVRANSTVCIPVQASVLLDDIRLVSP
ncbi:MAG: PHB depolymerase family esterase [Myxococcota bacterium]